jgi:ubiquinone/menaquinone biosynthesis C-methylase UbiE
MAEYKRYNEEKYKNNFWGINRSRKKWFSNYVKLKIFRQWSKGVDKKETFVDVGGGVGNWAFHFLEDYQQVIVVDISKTALNKIPEKKIKKKVGSVLDIPLKENSADFVLLADVLEHLKVKDVDRSLLELRRIVKKDGRIVIFTSQYGLGIRLLFNRLIGRVKGRLMKHELTEGHLNRFKFNELKKRIERNGLKIEDYYHYSIFFQETTDFVKDFTALIFDKIRKRPSIRKGQDIKNSLKETKGFAGRVLTPLLYVFSFISYLDILLFGKTIPGDTIFFMLKKV